MDLHEKTLESRLVFSGKILKVREKKVVLPDGSLGNREVVEHPGAVAVVPVDGGGGIYLVEQFRSPLERTLLEIPAGKLDEGESPLECARRELEEETGKQAGKIIKLARFYSSPGYSNEEIHLYLAMDLRDGEGSGVPGEFLHVKKYEVDRLLEMMERGEVRDGKTIMGITLALNRII